MVVDVEILGQHAVARGRPSHRVGVVRHDRADVAQLVEQVFERGGALGFDAQTRGRGFGRGLSDVEVVDRVAGMLVVHDQLEHASEHSGIDDVPSKLDLPNVCGHGARSSAGSEERLRRAGAKSALWA